MLPESLHALISTPPLGTAAMALGKHHPSHGRGGGTLPVPSGLMALRASSLTGPGGVGEDSSGGRRDQQGAL